MISVGVLLGNESIGNLNGGCESFCFYPPTYSSNSFFYLSPLLYRQIAGNAKDAGHGADAKEDDEFDASTVPFRRWEEYERAWRKSQWRKQQKMANAAAMHQMAAVAGGAIPYGIGPDGRPVSIAFYPVGSLMTPPPPPPSSLDGMSDLSASITSSAAAADNAAPVNHRFSMMSTQSIDDQGSVMTESESNFGGEMMQEEERRSQQQGFTSEVMSAAVTPIPHGPSSSSVVTAEEYKNLYN